MESLAQLQVTTSTALPVRKIKTIGKLELSQTSALQPAGVSIFKLYNDNYFNRLESVSSRTLMIDYAKRNLTTSYSLNGPAIVQYGQSDTLQIEMIVKVPQKQEI